MNNNFTPLPENMVTASSATKTPRSSNKRSVLVLLMIMTIIPLSYVAVQTYKLTRAQAATPTESSQLPLITPVVIPTTEITPTIVPTAIPTVMTPSIATPTAVIISPTCDPQKVGGCGLVQQ